MAKMKLELNGDGIVKMLKSDWAASCCEAVAEEANRRLGPGHKVSKRFGAKRVTVSLGTATNEAAQANMESNTLLKAIGR